MQPRHDNQNLSTSHYSWEITSLVDWCEGNFEIVWFIAEFFNTLTNIYYMLFAAFGLYNSFRYSYDRRFQLSYAALFIVGLGSALFHGSLQYHMQLLDEVPMLIGSAMFIYCCITPARSRPPTWAALALVLYPSITTGMYITNRIPEFFQYAYTLEVVLITGLAIWNLRYFPSASASQSAEAGLVSQKQGRSMFLLSLTSYVTATCFWVADNLLCYSHLVPIKEQLGWPLRVVFEFHGWWHFGTGFATYVSVTYMVAVRANAVALRDEKMARKVEVKWWGGWVPYVVLGEEEQRRVKVE
ncbi:ceramidase [Catenaria anguillulae PL171]|uniref:Ceramidase n=1 Tax=Catenaria anguillulae PL171 TaxID=765915 RepID=A0A1Y2I7D9_9FUNG|nr:ceramidase [Catenaria anguillulae PL171]